MQVGYDVGTFQYLFMVHFHSLYGFILDKDTGHFFPVQHRTAVGADIIGGAVAAILAVTVLKSALNGPSMWFFTLNITLVPVLVIGVLYLLLAAVIPLIVLHFFNKGTVVERLRTSE